MLRFSLASLMLLFASLSIGCGGSDEPASGFDQDELAKYAEENPAPYIGGDGEDFEEIE